MVFFSAGWNWNSKCRTNAFDYQGIFSIFEYVLIYLLPVPTCVEHGVRRTGFQKSIYLAIYLYIYHIIYNIYIYILSTYYLFYIYIYIIFILSIYHHTPPYRSKIISAPNGAPWRHGGPPGAVVTGGLVSAACHGGQLSFQSSGDASLVGDAWRDSVAMWYFFVKKPGDFFTVPKSLNVT